jgi:protein-S-isoprenylcysteine O-methyltransferase Ste14
MNVLRPEIPGLAILILSAVLVLVKKITTGSLLKGKPERGVLLWFTHAFNLFFLLALSPVVAILLVARKHETFDPTVIHLDGTPLRLGLEICGLVLSLTGYSLMSWALMTMRGYYQVGGNTPRPTDRLVVAGPYKLVRHPMYTSALCLSLGLSLLTRSMAVFALFGLYAGLILWLIPREEEGLRRVYGEPYLAYQLQTRRLLPLFF